MADAGAAHIESIAIGRDKMCTLITGDATCRDFVPSGSGVRPWKLPKAKQVAIHDDGVCVVAHDDSLWCRGTNTNGRFDRDPAEHRTLPDGTKIHDGPVRQVALSWSSMCVLLADGAARCFGADNALIATGVQQIVVSGDAACVLRGAEVSCLRDGALVAVEHLEATALTAAGHGACALAADQTARCWGSTVDMPRNLDWRELAARPATSD